MKEEVHDIQEVRGSNPCKDGEMRLLFVSLLITIALKLHKLTACYRNFVLRNLGRKKTLFTAYFLNFSSFSLTQEGCSPNERELFYLITEKQRENLLLY